MKKVKLNLKFKSDKNVQPVGTSTEGQLFVAKDNSAFCLKSKYMTSVRPSVVKPGLEVALVALQNLFSNQEVNAAAYFVLSKYIKELEKKTKTVNFKCSKMVDVFDLVAVIDSAKLQRNFTFKGESIKR